ncbi:hypothetical protein MTO96_021407 [Rhipicephalus appendiculatus]
MKQGTNAANERPKRESTHGRMTMVAPRRGFSLNRGSKRRVSWVKGSEGKWERDVLPPMNRAAEPELALSLTKFGAVRRKCWNRPGTKNARASTTSGRAV